MINAILPKLKDIFIGRHSELLELEGLWKFVDSDIEHFVHVFLNAPGVGKTTLIQHFGKKIESEKSGLYIKFTCSSDFESPKRINKSLVLIIQNKLLRDKETVVKEFINNNYTEDQAKIQLNNLQKLETDMEKLISDEPPSLNDLKEFFTALTNIIPIYLAADEIQEFQKLIFHYPEGEEKESETALRYFTKILKNLLNNRALLVLSGTRYHILSQIGEKIGSPIRQKVKPLVIGNFSEDELLEYVKQVKTIILSAEFDPPLKNLELHLNHYFQFLRAFSGGHPRTIEYITEQFLRSLPEINRDSSLEDYAKFMDYLYEKVEDIYSAILLTSEQVSVLKTLQVSKQYAKVKKWIISRGLKGLFLGKRPRDSHVAEDNEFKRIVYELMNIGIIVQNGSNNYYLTSYFHFNEFIKVYHEPFEEFLRQVMNNRYFKLMCGSHSGFGYTFEHVLTATLLIKTEHDSKLTKLPFDIKLIGSSKILTGAIEWDEIVISEGLIYQTPSAKSIDAFLLQEGKLVLIQITTANPPNPQKMEALKNLLDELSSKTFENVIIEEINGWMVSLFDFVDVPIRHDSLKVTAGSDLVPILGKDLYDFLINVKKDLY